jgi:hypothetical protein
MKSRPFSPILKILLLVSFLLAGCGGGSIAGPTSKPISVSLSVNSLTVPRDGTQVFVSILINSTSETAVVAVGGLPAGASHKYVASDTNPSGALQFTAGPTTPLGAYTLTIKVDSAGQTASTQLTLEVSDRLARASSRLLAQNIPRDVSAL